MLMNVGDLIKQKRLQLKENQSVFGERFNISHAAVSDMERGKTTHIPYKLIELLFSNLNKCKECGRWI